MKVGILGGTFNPIHNGHLILAQNALELCKLDKVLIMPAGVSYFKDQSKIVKASQRIDMIKLAIENNSFFELSTIETEREGNSYTYETIEFLKNNNSDYELFYIIGADTLLSMESWKNPSVIFENCTIVCAKRDNNSDFKLKEYKAYLEEKYSTTILIMKYPEVDISSSLIRERIQAGDSCRYYIPDKVREYINQHELYK